MPTFTIYCKAELEGIQEIVADLRNTSWCVDVVSSVDDSDKRERVTIDPRDEIELTGSRGTANFVVKFNGSVKQATANVKVGGCLEKGGGKARITAAQSDEWVPLVEFECRGLNITEWHPTNEFTVISSAGTSFTEADFSEGDWSEYDEEAQEPLSVTCVEWEIR